MVSTVVSRKPLGSFSSIPMTVLPALSARSGRTLTGSVPLEAAAPPHVGVRDEDRGDEQHHLDQAEELQLVERHGVGDEEHALDVEDDEEHRHEVVLDGEPAAAGGVGCRLDAALVGVELRAVVALRAGERTGADRDDREPRRDGSQDEDRYVRVHALTLRFEAPAGAGPLLTTSRALDPAATAGDRGPS